ncbi:helix-turn-helix domain-containing protein [Wenyingzhuangia sp. IMCC45574]
MIKALEFIIISGITIVASLIFMLIKAKKKELHFKLLTLFFIVLLNYLVIGYADINDFGLLAIVTYPIVDNIEFILGPLLLLYVEALFSQKKKINPKNLLHFIPGLVYFVFITIPQMISFFREEPIFSYLKLLEVHHYEYTSYTLLILYLIGYTYAAKRKYDHYKKRYQNNYASSSLENINWVNHMLIGMMIVCSIDCMIGIVSWISNVEYDSYYITMLLAAILINYLGYYGTNQTKMLLPGKVIEIKTKHKKVETNEVDAFRQKLERLFVDDKIHKNEELSLQTLAKKMDINHKKLSYLLNNELDTNFYKLVNQKRIDDVKEKIASPTYKDQTLIEIAHECGFQSKASFNRIFKKETGLSPTQYKKKVLVN